MTYIKWKDEVESYLISLPQDEKQKIFSYFSEMYADKRDAGKSEEQIIEEFGAPYDVAKKILAESRDAAAPQENATNVNVNINVVGGATSQGVGKELPERQSPPATPPVAEKPKSDASKIVIAIILTICLIPVSIFLIGAPIAGIVQGFATIGVAAGGLVAGKINIGYTVATIGYGFVNVGLGFILLAPFSLLNKFLWKKLTAFSRGK